MTAVTLASIPHRPPFLFVDEIVSVSDRRIVTRTEVDAHAGFFRGHYPQQPVMPGVLICEACFQAGALLIAHLRGAFDASNGVPVLTRIRDARFRRIVRPGDSLHVEVTLDDELDEAFTMTGRVESAGKPVLRAEFVCMEARTQEESP